MAGCATDALGRSRCAEYLRTSMQQIAAGDGRNCETVVSTAPPLIDNGWTHAYECPHGVVFYMEPTTDQQAEWARDGVE